MTNKEAIKYLQQLYPHGGHSWLDAQRMEAIKMAIDALQEEPVSEDLEEAICEYCSNPDNFATWIGGDETDDIRLIIKAIEFGTRWQKEQLLAKAVDIEVKVDAGGYPYIPQIELYDYDKDIPLAKECDKYKVILIKEDLL